MSYCVKCGHELIEKENGIDGMVPYCPNCQEFRFPMFNSAVSALVLNPKKDKILLIQQYGRKDNILIAGYVTKGENAKQALFREIKEETGLTLTSYHFRGIVTFLLKDKGSELTEYMCLYTSDEFTGIQKSCDEGELEWIPKENLKDLNMWPGDRIFNKLIMEDAPFFSLKLSYKGDELIEVVLNGCRQNISE